MFHEPSYKFGKIRRKNSAMKRRCKTFSHQIKNHNCLIKCQRFPLMPCTFWNVLRVGHPWCNGVLAMKTQSLSKIVLCHSGTLVSILLKRNSKPWKSVVLGMHLWSLLCSLQKLTQLKIQNIPWYTPATQKGTKGNVLGSLILWWSLALCYRGYEMLWNRIPWNPRSQAFHRISLEPRMIMNQWWPGKWCWFHKRKMWMTSPSSCSSLCHEQVDKAARRKQHSTDQYGMFFEIWFYGLCFRDVCVPWFPQIEIDSITTSGIYHH